MEVSQLSDSVTHAVLGKKESVEMGVSDSATLMHVLSTALYTHPMLAAVREIICNGWDGHIISGNTDKPLQITIDDQFVRIRDFGPGIPHDKIGEIYGMYGNSTKRHDGQQTGGFGLGSKAPFAYTDNFEVINHHGGEKVIYRVSKSSMQAGGKPSIDMVVRLPSTETGIQVSMNIQIPVHKYKFYEYIQEVLCLGEIKAQINGGEISEMLPLSESPTGYIIHSASGTLLQRINIRYGNVVYPVPRLDAFADEWDNVDHTMRNLWSGAKVIFMAPPNSITIAPSREALIFMEGTVETLKLLLGKFNPSRRTASTVTAKEVSRRQINKMIPHERKYLPSQLSQSIVLKAEKGTCAESESGLYSFDARKAAVSYAISRRSLHLNATPKIVIKRVKNAIYHGLVDKVRGKDFIRAAQKHDAFRRGLLPANAVSGVVAEDYLSAALAKSITLPLIEAIKSKEFMSYSDMYFCQQSYSGWETRQVSPLKLSIGDPTNLFGFLTPRVLLARSKKAISEYLNKQRHGETGANMYGWMVYHLPKSDKHYADIRKVFADLGYQVHTYLPVVERVERAKKSDDPNWVPAVKKPSVKRKGYLTLKSSRDCGNLFTLSNARENCKPEDHVQDPIAYVVLNSGSEYQRKRFTTVKEPEICRVICDVLGDQIAVITTTQVEKLEKLGVPELSTFIYEYVDNKLSSAKDFPRYLAFGRHVYSDIGRPTGELGILQGLTQHSGLASRLPEKFRFCVSAETLSLSRLYTDRGFRDMGLPKCNALSKKVAKSPEVAKLVNRIRKSEWFEYVDLDAVAKVLHVSKPEDESLRIPYEIVTNLMTPMEKQQ